MGRKPVYGEKERDFIVSNAATLKDKELAEQLSALMGKPVSVQSVRKQRQKLGVMKASGRGKCSIKKVAVDDEGRQQPSQPAASLPNNPSTTEPSPVVDVVVEGFVGVPGDLVVSPVVDTPTHNGDEGGTT